MAGAGCFELANNLDLGLKRNSKFWHDRMNWGQISPIFSQTYTHIPDFELVEESARVTKWTLSFFLSHFQLKRMPE